MIGGLANHLWQSTLFALAAGLLAVAFRSNRARVRYWIWFSASLKFLVPFALLTPLGSQLAWAPDAGYTHAAALAMTIGQVSEPFPGDSLSVPMVASAAPSSVWPTLAILAVWVSGLTAVALTRLRTWRRIRAAVNAGRPVVISGVDVPARLRTMVAPGLLEPGIVGIWQPVLMLPEDIGARLTRPQLEAVIAHELCHVRHQDNLTAAIHMLVEAVFWFHPGVWLIGARLLDERERACDEAVLTVIGAPRAYAEGILAICKRYVEAPRGFVSGVGGANLRSRIEAIMTRRIGRALNTSRKLMLATCGIASLALPIVAAALAAPVDIVIGATPTSMDAESSQTPPGSAPAGTLAFDVASVVPNRTGDLFVQIETLPGGRFVAINVPVSTLVSLAHRVDDYQIDGGPSWMRSDRFDVIATANAEFPPMAGPLSAGGVVPQLIEALLVDRFRMVSHRQQRDGQIYTLTALRPGGTTGNRLTRATIDCEAERALRQPGEVTPGCGVRIAPGSIVIEGSPLSPMIAALAGMLRRPVVDRTGLDGRFDLQLQWQPPRPPAAPGAPPAVSPGGPSLFTALQEQLGLKLDAGRGPVDFLVIDRLERPTGN